MLLLPPPPLLLLLLLLLLGSVRGGSGREASAEMPIGEPSVLRAAPFVQRVGGCWASCATRRVPPPTLVRPSGCRPFLG